MGTRSKLKIASLLGQGGFGRVLLVEHKHPHKLMALKAMSKKAVTDAKQEKTLLAERDCIEKFDPGQEKGDSTSLQRECSARARFGNSTHASKALREIIARPKISRNEWNGRDMSL